MVAPLDEFNLCKVGGDNTVLCRSGCNVFERKIHALGESLDVAWLKWLGEVHPLLFVNFFVRVSQLT